MSGLYRLGRIGILSMLLFVCGCARHRDERTGDGRLILDYWEKWTGFEGDAMQAVVDDFNASQDRLFVRKLTVSQIDQKVMLATAGGNPPDIAGLWSHSVPDFAEKGALTPLDKPLAKYGMSREDYIPAFWDMGLHRGIMWALPSTPSSLALHWNKKMFRDAGLDPEKPPRTLAELDAMAEKLTVVELTRDGKQVRVRYPELTAAERAAQEFTIVQIGHIPSEPGWWMPLWLYWFGGNLWDGDRRITADSPENVRALTWIESYVKAYGVKNLREFGAAFGNFSSPQNPFLSGKVAMELQGVWMYNFIEKYAPQLEWGAAPFPAADGDARPLTTIVECDVLVLPKGCPHPDEAFEFLRYVQSRPAMEKLNLGQRKFSPLASYSDDFVRRHPNPAIETFIELARSPNARLVPRISIWTEYSDEMKVATDRVLALSASPENALAEVQARVSAKFDRVQRRWELVRDKRLKEWRNDDTW